MALSQPKKKAAFIDRGEGFLLGGKPHRWTAPWNLGELRFNPEARAALELLERKGYDRILVTNQPDVATGRIDPEEFERMMALVRELPLSGIYVCMHLPKVGCSCRKPSPGMLFTGRDDHGIDMTRSFMIGDMESDIEAGRAAGVRTVLVTSDINVATQADHRVLSIMKAALLLP